MTTAGKRERKKLNRLLKLEELAQILDDALAHADDDVPEPERPESEKAAAQTALGATKRFRKKLKSD